MSISTFDSTFERLALLIPGHWDKVIVSVILIGLALLFSQIWARYLARGQISAQKRRLHLVWARNIIWFAALLAIISLWASTIAGFALSLAAVAGCAVDCEQRVGDVRARLPLRHLGPAVQGG